MRQQLCRVCRPTWLLRSGAFRGGLQSGHTHTHTRSSRCFRVTLVLCKTQLPTESVMAWGQVALMVTCAAVERTVLVCVCVFSEAFLTAVVVCCFVSQCMCVFCFGVTSLAKERTVATVIRRRWFIEVSTSPRSQTLLVSSWTPPQFELSLRSVCVCVCVGEREYSSVPLSPPLSQWVWDPKEKANYKKPLSPSLFCGHKPLLCFFVFILSPSLAFWHSSSIPTVPETPTHAHAHMQPHSFGSGQLFFFSFSFYFASDSSQSLKIASMLPGPSSAPYLIIFERKAGWDCLSGWLSLW